MTTNVKQSSTMIFTKVKRVVGMVFVGDTITVSGKVIEKEETEQGDVYTFDVQARNQKGVSVASGQVKFICYRD